MMLAKDTSSIQYLVDACSRGSMQLITVIMEDGDSI